MPPEWFRQWRRGQKEAIDEIVSHFEDGVQLVVLDAPTGTGKTLIGEGVRWGLRTKGVYLCTSLTLQDQFLHDFPDAAVLKGRNNYIPHFASGHFRHATCADCDKSQNASVEGEPVCSFCDPVWACPYESAKADALREDLACLNTRYFLTEANNVGRFTKLPFVVLDECDVMENELMGFIEARLTNRMRKLLNLPMPKKKTVAASWTEWFEKSLPKIGQFLIDNTPTEGDSLVEKRRYIAVTRLMRQLSAVAPQVENGGWVYDGYQSGDVAFKPVTVKEFGQQYLWRHAERWLCMSATIISAEQYVESLGFEGRWESVEMPSPFDPARRPIHYAPVANMKHNAKDTEWPKMADGISRVVNAHPDERILVHTNSYLLAAFCEARMASPRVRTYLDRADRQAAIEWFEQTENAVLLASSLDRGYDGADDLCRVVVIAKVPFPNLGDKQTSARLFSPGGKTWYGVQTARTLVQMAGRGMRHEDDYCKIVILDEQFEHFWRKWRKGVGKSLLLPQWITEAIVWGGAYRNELVRG